MKNDRFEKAVQTVFMWKFLKLRALLVESVLDLVLDRILSVPVLLAIHKVIEHPQLFISVLIL